MKKTIIITIGLLVIIFNSAFGQVSNINFNADDIIPVVAGGPADVAKPNEVKLVKDETLDVNTQVVEAATAQDATNAAVIENKSGKREVSCTCIKFPSGVGYVSTGAGFYRNMKNPNATRLSKRQAYVAAFIAAKKNLAEMLAGLSVKNIETLKESFESVTTSEESAQNLSSLATEDNKLVVDAVLRGFVVYSVEDLNDEQTVYVSIVSTPKTLGKFSRLSSSCITAETVQAGINEILNEIKSGLIPPVGGKLVQVKATGETAFIGCGSAVVETASGNAIQSRMNLIAKKIASARAKSALCGMLVADKIWWEGGVSSEQADSIKGFEITEDPINKNLVGNINKLDQAREDFYNKTKMTDSYKSIQEGKLPPGVNSKDWIDVEGAWAYSLAIYLPSASHAAANYKTEMDDSRLIQPFQNESESGTSSDGAPKPQSSDSHPMNSNIRSEGTAVEQGPTGTVTKDEEL